MDKKELKQAVLNSDLYSYKINYGLVHVGFGLPLYQYAY